MSNDPADPVTGKIFVVSAPSGAGKTTLIENMIHSTDRARLSVSHTTRKPRQGETEGRDYFFVDDETFQKMVTEKAFLESAQVHGHFYGTSRLQVMQSSQAGYDVFLDIDVQGARQIRSQFPQAIFIFILPPSLKVLENRLLSRGTEDPQGVKLRLENARREIKEAKQYSHVLINEDLNESLSLFKEMILAYRQGQIPDKWLQNFKAYPISRDLKE